jgi:hypothetical protein
MSSNNSVPPPPSLPIPLHLAPRADDGSALVVKRRPGRPRKIVPAPSADEAVYLEAANRARDDHIVADALVGVVQGREEPIRVLHTILHGLAVETAAIAWEIRQGRGAGRDVSQLCSRRIDGLCKIALVEVGILKLGLSSELTADDPRMRIITESFLASVGDVIEATLPAGRATDIMGKIARALRDGPADAAPRAPVP